MLNSIKNLKLNYFLLFCLSFVFFTAGNNVFAKEKYLSLKVKTNKSENANIMDLIKKFVKDGVEVSDKSVMAKKSDRANPKLSLDDEISPGTKVKVYIAKSKFDRKKWKAYLKEKKRLKRIAKRKVSKKKKSRKKKRSRNFNISSQMGVVSITSDNDETLVMNLMKFGAGYSNKLNKNLRYHASFSMVSFTNVDSSLAAETASTESFLPELNLGISRRMSAKFSASLNYDLLNYFVVGDKTSSTIKITPHNVHRLSIRPSYSFTSSLTALTSLGYVFGKASGLDFSLGMAYSFGRKNVYSLAVITYMSQLDVDGNSEAASGSVISAGYKF